MRKTSNHDLTAPASRKIFEGESEHNIDRRYQPIETIEEESFKREEAFKGTP